MAASDIGDTCPPGQLPDDAVERRQQGREQVRVVAGPEEPLGAVKQAWVVLAPFHALAAPEVLDGTFPDVKEIAEDIQATDGALPRQLVVQLKRYQ